MRATIVGVIGLMCVATAAQGQLDGPLPSPFTYHLWTVPGVINNGMATMFACTNASSSSVTVGVEVFGSMGVSANNPATTAIAIAPSATVHFASGPVAALTVDSILAVGIVHRGSARILATGKGIICSAYITAHSSTPPTSMVSLNIVKKTKQKGD